MAWDNWDEHAQSIDPEGYKAHLENERLRQRELRARADAELRCVMTELFGGEISSWPTAAGEILGRLEGARFSGVRGRGVVWLKHALARIGHSVFVLRGNISCAVPADLCNACEAWLRTGLTRNHEARVALGDVDQALFRHLESTGQMRLAVRLSIRYLAQIFRDRGDTVRRGSKGLMLVGYRIANNS